MSLPRCLLCNSASHSHMACNSNMKGRRDMLVALGKSMMMDNIMPDFKSFPIDELKYIAHTYTTEILGFNRYKPLVAVKSSVHVDKTIARHLFTPIILTLTKTRLVKELTLRWNYHRLVREKKHTMPESEDCPMCMECMVTPEWNEHMLRWDLVDNQSTNGVKCYDNIITKCRHKFCGRCWELHMNTNAIYDWGEQKYYISCPLCRTKIYLIRRQ